MDEKLDQALVLLNILVKSQNTVTRPKFNRSISVQQESEHPRTLDNERYRTSESEEWRNLDSERQINSSSIKNAHERTKRKSSDPNVT